MPSLDINGVNVNFPFEPYNVQKEYMIRVITSLQQGFNCVLESPTGTGKTLSLLCACLAWQETKKAQVQATLHLAKGSNIDGGAGQEIQNQLAVATGSQWGNTTVPKIIYSSRTHSQLSQVMSELKRTNYSHCKTAILGSRQQLCIHPAVSEETNPNMKRHMCHALIKNRQCHFNNNLENSSKVEAKQIMDIEDLITVGKKSKICPYYLARNQKNAADVIFMPYQYLLDHKTRKAQGIELDGSVVIFDEAHNIETICEETASCELHSHDLAACIDEVTSVMEDLQKIEAAVDVTGEMIVPEFNSSEVIALKTRLLELEKAIATYPLGGSEVTVEGSFIFQWLDKAEIFIENSEPIFDLVERIIQYLSSGSRSVFQRKGRALGKFLDALKVFFNKDIPFGMVRDYARKFYRVHIQEDKRPKRNETFLTSSKSPNARTVSYWCFSPALTMKSLISQKVHSIIITSGTLSPLETFKTELQIPIQISLANPHIIGESQVMAGVVCKGPDETPLNSSYQNRNEKFIDSLGRTILLLCRFVPDGILVFFPSYSVMKTCRERWECSGTWTKISELKIPVVEQTGKSEFQSSMKQYYDTIKDPKIKQGAIFFAVFRGKVSEGLDFADANGRAVVVAGIPFANKSDVRVQNKCKYLNEVHNGKNSLGLNGQEWYLLQAVRAVNQAVGRVIRHKDDYGAILLCDERFSNPNTANLLSSWLKTHVQSFNNFGAVLRKLKIFYSNAEETLPQPGRVKRHLTPQSSRMSYDSPSGFSFTKSPANLRITNNHGQNLSQNTSENYDWNVLYPSSGQPVAKITCSSRGKSCLDMLESVPSSSPSRVEVVKVASSEKSSDQDGDVWREKLSKRKVKKIVIKRRLEEDSNEDNQQVIPTSSKQSRNDQIKTILIRLKQNLSNSDYMELRNKLKTLNQGDLRSMIHVLADASIKANGNLTQLFNELRNGFSDQRRPEYDRLIEEYLLTNPMTK